MSAEKSVLQNLGEELLGAFGVRRVEELLGGEVFNDFACVHEDHAVGHLAGEAHFVGHDHHGHAFLGELDHHVEHFIDHFRVEGGRRFVLGLAVVGLEVGAIFMYKVGWEVSVGNIVQAIFVAIALLVVGVMVYKEPLTGTKLAGIAACLVGIFLLNK